MAIKVVNSVLGKFHYFHLARYLNSIGMLERIFSAYPEWKLREQGIPSEKLSTFPPFWLLDRAYSRYGPRIPFLNWRMQRLSWKSFDNHVAAKIPECDVFIGGPGSSLKTGSLVQRRGGKYIFDHVSSHIRFRDRIMAEEFKIWGQECLLYDPLYTAQQQREYEKSDLIAVPSEFVRRSFISEGVDEKKVVKIPYGADLSRFSKVADPDEDSFNVLFVGQVSLRKGIPYLLKAFNDFSHPRKRLKIVGSIAPEIKPILDANLSGDIEVTGPLPHAQLKEVMSRSHVMIVPSIEEGLACVQGEALACGCPIISSTNAGAEDLFQHGSEGFIVPIRNAGVITQHMEQLAQDPDLRLRMSEAALRRVKALGGWETYARIYVQQMEHLVNSTE